MVTVLIKLQAPRFLHCTVPPNNIATTICLNKWEQLFVVKLEKYLLEMFLLFTPPTSIFAI
jgi:hypothetical protein